MDVPRKTVFISYASEDAEAAQRICATLRAGGIEVWFDRSELRGGDVWDSSIREQIRTCALFIPIISSNTEARAEGYFRREWRIAVDRTHDMADDQPFLLPIAIDGTSGAAARVPTRFRQVQWTRLPGGDAPGAFVDQLQRLLVVSGTAVTPSGYSSDRAATAEGSLVASRPLGPLSIMVVPFANQTGEESRSYIADALTSAVTSDLARIRDVQVLPAAAALIYKNRPLVTQQMGKDAGVRFVLLGGVLSSGDKLRVSAQLADTLSGVLVWSEILEGSAADLFGLLDQFTTHVHHSIGRQMLVLAARDSERRKSSSEVGDLMLRARALSLGLPEKLAEWRRAEDAYRQVLVQDPANPMALAGLARILGKQIVSFKKQLDASTVETVAAEAETLALRAKASDAELPDVYSALAFLAWDKGEYRRAIGLQETRVALSPRDPGALVGLADAYQFVGQFEKALELANRALAADPVHPVVALQKTLADVNFRLGHYPEAISWYQRVFEHDADWRTFRLPRLAMAYGLSGDQASAAGAVATLKREQPSLTGSEYLKIRPSFSEDRRQWNLEVLVPAWLKAGLPD